MSTHLTLIRCPFAFRPHPARREGRGGRDSSPVSGHWSGPARLTTPDATGRRFVLTLVHPSDPSERPGPGRRRHTGYSGALDHPA